MRCSCIRNLPGAGTAIAMTTLLLAACSARAPVPAPSDAPPVATAPVPAPANPQLAIPIARGIYRCEQNARVEVRPDTSNATRLDLGWNGQSYTLTRYDSSSGLPRFEDKSSQLVWVVLPWKSVLLDGQSGQPLANECKPG